MRKWMGGTAAGGAGHPSTILYRATFKDVFLPIYIYTAHTNKAPPKISMHLLPSLVAFYELGTG